MTRFGGFVCPRIAFFMRIGENATADFVAVLNKREQTGPSMPPVLLTFRLF